MKKIFLILCCGLLLNCTNKAEEKKAELAIKDLEARVNHLQEENDSLATALEALQNSKNKILPEAFDSIANPERFLTESLQNRPALIPEEGVLGGAMQFINIEILNDRFIWAEFEDGHINGKALYSYFLSEEGKPEFKFISTVEE